MPSGAGFNVLIPAAAAKANATPLNSEYYFTAILTAKGKPDAILLFTHMYNPYPVLGGGVEVRYQGLGYPASNDPKNPLYHKWYISNLDHSNARVAGYFIVDTATIPVASGAVRLLHVADAGNTSGSATSISAFQGATNVVFFSPVGVNAVDKALGTFWDGAKWNINHEDGSAMNAGETFNVLMFPAQIP
jgi:hypothetical protein